MNIKDFDKDFYIKDHPWNDPFECKCKLCLEWWDEIRQEPDEDDELWAEWEIEHADELKSIDELETKGHSPHCACRIVWGDGECTCSMEKIA